MTEPTLFFVDCADAQGGHRMGCWQWGNAHSANLVLCVHGLTRQGRDFDVLAQAIVARAGGDVRVVCPDVVGRGESDWLVDPQGYQVPLYAADMLALLAQLQADRAIAQFDYVGTSMGGLIGLVLAGNATLALPAPIRRLVINDVGPTIDAAALQRIGLYLGNVGRFATLQEAADAMWTISQSFGPHTPDEWLALSRAMVVPASRRTADGAAKRAGDATDAPFVLHYDPAIAVPFQAITPEAAAQGEAALWSLYDAIQAETLLTRGAQSDLLSHDTALAMTQRGPKARLVEFAGVGHAPTFVKPDQVAAVTSFLFD
ncbi:alpha/beta fold hydrolase [Variovorax arabinosiphilus]|uniref:alpha/beta fold hydrolase n=1 Tax=Variovorax arabinosiphilus TaxID=3053498 RepID=UPI002574FA84|nr:MULTISPECIES: alpha/beta fold hydrolase [unclassified Variovorax]MDM0119160.1 alpha/beta fold hydrolase [Variovorax sp. J2L1-78]MDM0129586.1 alpha/beta fold hydrolase [Variovorax sp. J2L1-63]MDM0232628.1 alpha/beta fold hydrolase [Variovorax sp. J2R1-6]